MLYINANHDDPQNRRWFFSGNAGATRSRISISISGLPKPEGLMSGSLKVKFAGSSLQAEYTPEENGKLVIVYVHDGDADTFQGVGVATIDADGRLVMQPHKGIRWTASSSSGRADIFALLSVLEPDADPLSVYTSGYRQRSGHIVRTIAPDGAISMASKADWLAAKKEWEAL